MIVGLGGLMSLHLPDEFYRRMNDENYHIALEKFRQEQCDKIEQKIAEEIKEKPWRKKHYARMQKRLNALQVDDFMEFLNKCIANEAEEITEFNKKWDRQNYKVVPFK